MRQTMSENLRNDTTDRLGETSQARVLGAPISRRSVLFKGLGKGSAVLVAAVPIKTLASTPSVTANGKICTISGVQSAVHSASTNLPTCGGLSPGYYKMLEHWPYYSNTKYIVGAKTFTQKSTFRYVFGGGLVQGLLSIMQTQPNNNDEFHWIAALLNAIKAPAGYVFPYTAQEVLSLYASGQKAAALDFFKNYMETI
jgi:hypothetical protein